MTTRTTVPMSGNPAVEARRHPALLRLLRTGWFAKGVVYVLAGVFALTIWQRGRNGATGQGQEASPTGAVEAVAHATGGKVLLAALTVGLLAYAAWRVLGALLPTTNDAESIAHRIGYLVSAALYVSLAVTAIALLRSSGDGSTDGNSTATEATADLMERTAGRWLVGLAGVIALAVAFYRARKGVERDVEDELDLSGLLPNVRKTLQWMAAAGEIGRGVAIGLIGFFLVRAAITYDAAEATGLDGALRRLLENAWGEAVVIVVGIGFVAYGLFCLLTFTRRRLEAA